MTDPQNCRPISLLPCYQKLLKWFLITEQRSFWVRTKFSTSFKRVFEKTTLQTLALDILLIKLLSYLKKPFSLGWFLLIYKVFDIIDHKILLKKMKYLGFSKNSIALLKSYLFEQKFKMSINTSYSRSYNLLCGIPQGSILGPILFPFYINNLPQAVASNF